MRTRNPLGDLAREVHTTVYSAVAACIAFLRREPEAGYTTETVVVTASLIVLALIVLAVLAAKVVAKANGITL